MSRLDALPPDQRATLSLLLGQHKSYTEVAALLAIPERAVHDRAQAALAVLAPREARELTSERREAIGDYLLGQQTGVAERLAARTYLDGSPDGRAWAQAIADELAPLSNGALPEIPAGAGTPPPDVPGRPPAPQAAADGPAPTPGRSRQPGSRVGGAILLAVIVVGVIVAVVLLAGGGGGSKATSAGAGGKTSTTSKSSTTPSASPASGASGASGTGGTGGTGPTVDQRLPLTSPDPSSKAVGEVEILSEGSKTAFYLAAEHLPPTKGFFYAVWLYNSPTSHEALSKSPPVGSDGTLQGGALLPANAGDYHQILLTRETSDRPTHPGPIVLSGPFSLGK
jgi:hypothetical protein